MGFPSWQRRHQQHQCQRRHMADSRCTARLPDITGLGTTISRREREQLRRSIQFQVTPLGKRLQGNGRRMVREDHHACGVTQGQEGLARLRGHHVRGRRLPQRQAYRRYGLRLPGIRHRHIETAPLWTAQYHCRTCLDKRADELTMVYGWRTVP